MGFEQQVECFSSSAYANRPTVVHVDGQRLIVTKVLAESRTPRGKEFHVQAGENRYFILEYEEGTDTWRVSEQ